jgi:choline monooxygenase
VPNVGDMHPVKFAGYSLLMTRQADGSVKCFYNICPHRGMVLKTARASAQSRIVCSYHCWTFGLDGQLLATPNIAGVQKGTFKGQDKSALGLKAIRTEMWFDMVFVNLDGAAPPLLEHLAPLVARLPAENLLSVRNDGVFAECVRDANWKLVIEIGIEDYHIPQIHKINYNETYTDEDGGDAYQGFSAHWGYDVLRRSPEAGVKSERLPLLPTYERTAQEKSGILFLLPTGQVSFGADMIRLTTLNPIAVDHTLLRHSFYFRGEAASAPRFEQARKEIRNFWEHVGNEDDDLMRTLQGMTKARDEAEMYPSFSPRWERNVHAFHKYLGRFYA